MLLCSCGLHDVQAAVLLLVSVIYIVYLRIVVPYSRRDEMALEYFVALLDIVLFAMLLVRRLGLCCSGRH